MNDVAIQFLGRECERCLRVEALALQFGDVQVAASESFAAQQLSQAAFDLAGLGE